MLFLKVPLGVLLKNENVTEDMIEILETLHKYVPQCGSAGGLKPVFLGGDQLTCERIRGAKLARLQAPQPSQRLEGLSAKVEDWHALQAYYQVIWDTLYSTSSSRDQCTLYQLRTLIDRRNVVRDPKKDLHACQSFLSVVLEAMILAVFTTTCNIESLESADICTILKHDLPATSKERMDCLTQLASKVVDTMVLCPNDSLKTPHHSDDLNSYSSKVLSMGLLAWGMEDAIREGDGGRMIRLWKFLLVLFKQAGKHKYALEAMRLISDVKIALNEKQAHELTWNRTCNPRGRVGGNKPLDLHLEHMNRTFKDDISSFSPHLTESSVQKTAHASPVVATCIAQVDKQLNIMQDSGYHVVPSDSTDRKTIYQQLIATKACKYIPDRQYTHFKGISSHLYSEIRQAQRWQRFTEWMDSKLKEFSLEVRYKEHLKKKGT